MDNTNNPNANIDPQQAEAQLAEVQCEEVYDWQEECVDYGWPE